LKATGATIPEDMIVNKTKVKIKGKKFNTSLSGTGATVDTEAVVADKIKQVSNPSLYLGKNSKETANIIKEVLGVIPGIVVTPQGGLMSGGNKITITKKGHPTLILNSNEGEKASKTMAKNARLWLEKNLTDDEKLILSGEMGAAGAGSAQVNYNTK
jgi:glycerate-2-kinase